MRKADLYGMSRADGLALLSRAHVVRVAGTTREGAPVLRTVHGVVVGDAVAFHGAPVGEKTEAIGREVVVAADEIVAQIPSYFVDPDRACPATTYYRSVQVHGVLEEVDEPPEKAAVLAALLAKMQPEGGHVPIDAAHPLYRKAIEGLMVVRVPVARMDAKAKVGQNRRPEEIARICERLWARGGPGDARAIDTILAANPRAPRPPFLAAPAGVRLACALGEEDAARAALLLEGQYWLERISRERLARAHLASSAWVGAHDEAGALVATARAIADGARLAWVLDVCVSPAWRGRGLGRAVVGLLLGHAAVRDARVVRLRTRDAQRLYERFGFVDVRTLPPPGWPTMEMQRART